MNPDPNDRQGRFAGAMPLAAGSGVDFELAQKSGFTFTDLTKKDLPVATPITGSVQAP